MIARQIGRRCQGLATMTLRSRHSSLWQSLLYDGAHHRIALGIRAERLDESLDAIRAEIDRADISVPGHILADIRITDIARATDETVITLDVLTLEA